MIVVAFIFVALLIVYGAFRIILGWVLPQPALAAFDRSVSFVTKLIFQVSIVGLAGIILYMVYLSRQP